MLLIGIGNRARQGKDTMASAIVDYYIAKEISVQRIGFADALYEVCRNEYGMVEKDAPLLQQIGSERRQIDEDYWIKKAFAKIHPKSQVVVIPDMRYENEAAAIKKLGGYTVNVTRIMKNGQKYIDSSRPSDHSSEVSLDNYNFDFRIINQDSHEGWLVEQAITLAEYLRGVNG